MKELILRELFWLVISFLISLVASFLFLEFLALSSSEPELNSLEKLFTLQLYIIGCIVSFISVYIVRVVVSFIKKKI
jgi:hypothetical protein|tara:strand:+ start:3681 stop:3911 length:231 start_codon:yes stop_codon:yes gene_type:complete